MKRWSDDGAQLLLAVVALLTLALTFDAGVTVERYELGHSELLKELASPSPTPTLDSTEQQHVTFSHVKCLSQWPYVQERRR